jgi:L-lactate dehydrogenase (cytochrome)
MSIMMDGGIRRGSDVPKALALGAQFVFIGRPFLYAAAIAGAAGVHHAASILKDEISREMAMLGISSLAEMKRELLIPARGPI